MGAGKVLNVYLSTVISSEVIIPFINDRCTILQKSLHLLDGHAEQLKAVQVFAIPLPGQELLLLWK